MGKNIPQTDNKKPRAKTTNAEREKNFQTITEAFITAVTNPDCPDALRRVITDALIEAANEHGGFDFDADVMRVWLPKAMRKMKAAE